MRGFIEGRENRLWSVMNKQTKIAGLLQRFGWTIVPVLTIWAVQVLNVLSFYSLNTWFGLVPRSVAGLDGIIFMPLLHTSFAHAFANTGPLFVFSLLLALTARDKILGLTVTIVVLGGSAVWIFGAPAIHVGASGLIFGYFGYLVSRGFVDRKPLSVLVSISVAIAYGAMVLGVLPNQPGISWESHLFGALVGLGYAVRRS